jgi:hypothetical protein
VCIIIYNADRKNKRAFAQTAKEGQPQSREKNKKQSSAGGSSSFDVGA